MDPQSGRAELRRPSTSNQPSEERTEPHSVESEDLNRPVSILSIFHYKSNLISHHVIPEIKKHVGSPCSSFYDLFYAFSN